jgi:hypothetical protein
LADPAPAISHANRRFRLDLVPNGLAQTWPVIGKGEFLKNRTRNTIREMVCVHQRACAASKVNPLAIIGVADVAKPDYKDCWIKLNTTPLAG